MGLKHVTRGGDQCRDWAKTESELPAPYSVCAEASDTTASTCGTAAVDTSYYLMVTQTYITIT